MYMASVCIWPVYVYGQCMYMASVCIWPVYVYGQCMYMASVCIWPVYVFGQCMYGPYMYGYECTAAGTPEPIKCI